MRATRSSWPKLSRVPFTVAVIVLATAQLAADVFLTWGSDPNLMYLVWYILRLLYLGFPWLWLGQDATSLLLSIASWALSLSLLTVLVLLRLNTLGWPLRWSLLLLVPGVSLVFLGALCLAPEKRAGPRLLDRHVETPDWIEQAGIPQPMAPEAAATSPRPETAAELEALSSVGDGFSRRLLVSELRDHAKQVTITLGLVMTVGIVMVVWATLWVGVYGLALFIVGPFLLGWWLTILVRSQSDASLGDCCLLYGITMLVGGGWIFILGAEGLVCLLMSAPIVLLTGLVGCALAYWMSSYWHINGRRGWYWSAALVIWPIVLGAETVWPLPLQEHAVRTEIIINAPPERVWQTVITFPPLPEPSEWLFRWSAAYPVAAEIHGEGVGAVRYCIFNTGSFVEPIEVWDPPRCLRFAVTDQPPPMRELSPWQIHPPHLEGYLVCRRGEFLLEPLEDGTTRLIGTTWYTNSMWPQWYWYLWSDYCIHAIHYRVLVHIQRLAEGSP